MSAQVQRYYLLLALVMLAAVVATLAIGGRPDPSGPAAVLDGHWRFHAGDNPGWADPGTDDSDWDRIDLQSRASVHDTDVGLPGWLPGWRARGDARLGGYGWYRRHVVLPPAGDLALLGPTMVDDGYQMFWNGRPLGGVGKLEADPRVFGTRPYLITLVRHGGERSAVLAIRAYMEPRIGHDDQGGGLRSVPSLALLPFGEQLYAAQWRRTIAGYIVEVALPIMMGVLAGIALVMAPSLPRPGFARWLAVALIATACLRLGNALSSWTDVIDLVTLDRQDTILLAPLAMLAWTAAWNDWTDRKGRRIVLGAALLAWLTDVCGAVTRSGSVTMAGRAAFLVLLFVIALCIATRGPRRWLVLATMLIVAVPLFITELSRLGVPTIWFPFNIGVTLTQFAYAGALVLLSFVLTRQTGESDAT